VTQQSTNGGNNDQYKSPPPANFDWVRGSAEGYNNNNNSNVGPSSSSASNYYNAAEGGSGQYVYNRGGGVGEGSGIAGNDALVDFEAGVYDDDDEDTTGRRQRYNDDDDDKDDEDDVMRIHKQLLYDDKRRVYDGNDKDAV
jgi:hypothetical protein